MIMSVSTPYSSPSLLPVPPHVLGLGMLAPLIPAPAAGDDDDVGADPGDEADDDEWNEADDAEVGLAAVAAAAAAAAGAALPHPARYPRGGGGATPKNHEACSVNHFGVVR